MLYSSSSSSTFVFPNGAAFTTPAGAGVELVEPVDAPETAVFRAALRLCVEVLSTALLWSILGRAFFSGLPTIASGGTS